MGTAYVETTMIGNLVARGHPNPVVAGRQTVTRARWSTAPSSYRLPASQLVLEECGGGDSEAAAVRLDALRIVELLDASVDVDSLATALTNAGAVPASEPRDAYHIAIAAVNGVKYLVTRNLNDIANAATRDQIEMACRAADSSRLSFARPMNFWRPTMFHDTTTAEIRAIRHALAAQFENKISRIGNAIR